MNHKDIIYKSILEIIKQEFKPIPAGILVEKVCKDINYRNKSHIYDAINELIAAKNIKKLDSGKLVEGYINNELLNQAYQGIIHINSNLDGYVKIISDNESDKDREAYINNINLNGALTGDLVEFKYMKDKFTKANVQHGVVTKIIERSTKFVVGTFQLIGSQYNVKLDDTRNYYKVILQDIEHLANGHKILIQIKEFKDNIIYGNVSRILGHKDDAGVDILSIIVANDIKVDFSQEALDYANKCKVEYDNKDIRKDIRDRNIITIDPATSKDLDDAIYVKKLANNNFFLSVSIADVSHYVKYDSVLWTEACNRSTSVYLTDRVIPMLPHILSNNICSLNPNVERLCMTCDLEVDQNGNYHNINVYPSIIKSKKRLSYDEVNNYFNGSNGWDQDLNLMLNDAKQLHEILRKNKEEAGYIDFDIKEPKIILDEKGWPIDIKIYERGIAQKMIEDFMIAANEAVTIKAKELNIPFIYRTHENPKLEKLEMFSVEAKKLGFMINKNDFENITPKTIAKWLNQNKNNPNINLLSKLLLRCMQKAKYSIKNIGHFGLSSQNYSHFTSPIRRSADMVVHQLYWMNIFNRQAYTDEQRSKFCNELEQLCNKFTDQEIVAISTEREVNQLKFCQYMKNKINEIYDGVISTIKPFGMFIELDNTIEVLVKINDIGKDFWKYVNETNIIMGTKTNKVFSFGQKLKVKITNVNIIEKQINAYIIGYEPEINDKYNQRRQNHRKIKY